MPKRTATEPAAVDHETTNQDAIDPSRLTEAAARHAVKRVRYELRGRLLTVARVERPTPRTVRVTLTGDDLDGFVSGAFDDHVKLFFPLPGEQTPRMPDFGPNGAVFADGAPRSPMRDFTPRRHASDARELTIDFALHEAGPATAWAAAAAPGQVLGVAGPRGSFIVSNDFDWYLLIGDETALPAIARRLEELPAGTHAIVCAAVTGRDEELALRSAARLDLHWVHRGADRVADPAPLRDIVASLRLPDGDGYAWVACESAAAKLLREDLVGRGQPASWIRASGYWRQGTANVHESHNG